MSDVINLLKNAAEVDASEKLDVYTRVIVNTGDQLKENVSYIAEKKNDYGEFINGRTMEITNPLFGSQVAEKLLNRFYNSGLRFQPYKVDGALLSPAAEMGDAVSINDVHGGIYTRSRTFGTLMKSNVSAPVEEEINHEYEYKPQSDRTFKRAMGETRAMFSVQEEAIEARVSKTSPDGQTSFWWKLLSDSWSVGSGTKTVFSITQDSDGNYQAMVDGMIKATSGYIGNSTNGFSIGSQAIYNGISTFGQNNVEQGIYLGTNGIQLGKNFKVSLNGSIVANTGTFGGTTYAGNIASGGGGGGTMSGGLLSANSVGSDKWKAELRKEIDDALKDIDTLKGYFTGAANFSRVDVSSLWINGHQVSTGSIKDGNGRTISGVMFCL